MIDIDALKRDKRPQSSTLVHALIDRLEAAEKSRDDLLACLGEWLDKTKWVQQGSNEGTISAKYIGLHRADVMARLLDEAEKERDALHAKITEMEQQEPARLVTATAYRWRYRGAVMWQYGELTEETARRAKEHNHEVQPLYTLPGTQNVPEKLCYDSRWEISIDYVDGWNAAVDMMRGKSPSWHCPDCCIAFPFGAPKSCPNDDARCNSLLAAAPEAKP